MDKLVKLKVEVKDWESSIRESGQLLVNEGYIENGYVEAMIDSVNELGPYMVIAPGIALAHARPGEFVNKQGFSLITLKEPVEFGHPENDPVDIVISLAALDHNSHLGTLQSIVKILGNEELLDKVRTFEENNDIIELLKEEML